MIVSSPSVVKPSGPEDRRRREVPQGRSLYGTRPHAPPIKTIADIHPGACVLSRHTTMDVRLCRARDLRSHVQGLQGASHLSLKRNPDRRLRGRWGPWASRREVARSGRSPRSLHGTRTSATQQQLQTFIHGRVCCPAGVTMDVQGASHLSPKRNPDGRRSAREAGKSPRRVARSPAP